jgi:hypothetical protein
VAVRISGTEFPPAYRELSSRKKQKKQMPNAFSTIFYTEKGGRHSVLKITYDDYDRIMDRFDSMDTPAYLPTAEDIELFEDDPDKWVLFACYCHDRCGKPKTKSESYRKKKLLEFIERSLELTD